MAKSNETTPVRLSPKDRLSLNVASDIGPVYLFVHALAQTQMASKVSGLLLSAGATMTAVISELSVNNSEMRRLDQIVPQRRR